MRVLHHPPKSIPGQQSLWQMSARSRNNRGIQTASQQKQERDLSPLPNPRHRPIILLLHTPPPIPLHMPLLERFHVIVHELIDVSVSGIWLVAACEIEGAETDGDAAVFGESVGAVEVRGGAH